MGFWSKIPAPWDGLSLLQLRRSFPFRGLYGDFGRAVVAAIQRILVGTVSDKAEIFAEAEGGDALLERSAMAILKLLEKGFETEGTGDAGFDFGELSGGELFPARADGSVVTEAAEEELDFREGETHFSGEADEQDAVERVEGIAALAASTVRRSEEAEFLVVANGGSAEACATGEFTDFHGCFL